MNHSKQRLRPRRIDHRIAILEDRLRLWRNIAEHLLYPYLRRQAMKNMARLRRTLTSLTITPNR
jgi:hypothetical protein